MSGDIDAYERQGFGADLQPEPPYGVLIVDLVNGFADPAVFGGGNIPQAIANTERLLAAARQRGWPVAHSRIVFSDSGADNNIFVLKGEVEKRKKDNINSLWIDAPLGGTDLGTASSDDLTWMFNNGSCRNWR